MIGIQNLVWLPFIAAFIGHADLDNLRDVFWTFSVWTVARTSGHQRRQQVHFVNVPDGPLRSPTRTCVFRNLEDIA
jgi:hypothetical protein